MKKALKIIGIVFITLILLIPVLFYACLIIFEDKPPENENDWRERVEIEIDMDNVFSDVVQFANSYDENAELRNVEYRIYSTGMVEVQQRYYFLCPEADDLPNGWMEIIVYVEPSLIRSVAMIYFDYEMNTNTMTMDEALKNNNIILDFISSNEWADNEVLWISWDKGTVKLTSWRLDSSDKKYFHWEKVYDFAGDGLIERTTEEVQ